MTAWYFNPPEPTGQAFQPAQDIDAMYYRAGVSLFSRGRCGSCLGCPPMWRMEVPAGLGGSEVDPQDPPPGIELVSWSSIYSGNYYFRRETYGINQAQNCSWSTQFGFARPDGSLDIQFPDENRNASGTADSVRYYELFYGYFADGLNWYLITPLERTAFDIPMQSYYKFNAEPQFWRCLGANEFVYMGEIPGPGLGFEFPYRPARLTVTPFYG